MRIEYFFDKNTSTFTYVVSDPQTQKCAIIDPVLDYDIYSGKTSTISANNVIDYIMHQHLKVDWILETHVHADHLTASHYLQSKLGGKIAIGEHIIDVLAFWAPIFNIEDDMPKNGSHFNHLFKDGEMFNIGNISVKVISTPGHTPACISYYIDIGDSVFVGDTIFMPYVGTARTDFPGGNASTLYKSIQKIFSLPDKTKIFTCHDYPTEGTKENCLSTVYEQKTKNIMINTGINETQFIYARNKKDYGKPVPNLLLPAIQINLRAGRFGKTESNGIQYIKIPIDKL